MDVQYRNVGITYASNNCISFVKVSGLHFPFLKQVYKSPHFKALYALPLTPNTKTLYCIGQSFMLWIFRMRCQSSQIRLRKCLLCITFILKLMECINSLLWNFFSSTCICRCYRVLQSKIKIIILYNIIENRIKVLKNSVHLFIFEL